MLLPDTAERQKDGHLAVGGCRLAALAAEHGTPLYVYDEATLRSRLRAYRRALAGWPPGGDVLYSAKAYIGVAMLRLLAEEGCGVDVVSGGELELALRAGMPPAAIGFPGNNKSAAEVDLAARRRIGHLVVDSSLELEMVGALRGVEPARALLRVSPSVQPDTHAHISTGQLDSKFGFPIETGAALEAVRQALATPNLELLGLHMHIGSQLPDATAHTLGVARVADLLADLRDQLGFTARTLSLGGGLGIAHTGADTPMEVADFCEHVLHAVKANFDRNALPLPLLCFEPGRSVAGPAGVAVYSVGARKVIPGVRTYVSVDGGMADNLRPNLYGARYEPLVVVERPGAELETVSLAGRYCEQTDILVGDARLPRLCPGELVALPAAGAYTLSMSSNYNAAVRPAVVFVAGGRARLVRRRETLDDWLAAEVVDG